MMASDETSRAVAPAKDVDILSDDIKETRAELLSSGKRANSVDTAREPICEETVCDLAFGVIKGATVDDLDSGMFNFKVAILHERPAHPLKQIQDPF